MFGPSWKAAEQSMHNAWFVQLLSCYLPPKLLEINPQDSRKTGTWQGFVFLISSESRLNLHLSLKA